MRAAGRAEATPQELWDSGLPVAARAGDTVCAPATRPGGWTTSRITAATVGGKSMRSERIAANIAKLPELARGEGRRLIERPAACFIVRDHALAETIVLVRDGR
jgi:hypothetical protein